ncbi:hypothetical protein QNO07_03855 [Streptomyces sp. 549]|nr:hypothetical protein [Streptomyces sp. 549]MDK1472570.1 hypothetical protein [Streptomyces sp. 549]
MFWTLLAAGASFAGGVAFACHLLGRAATGGRETGGRDTGGRDDGEP